MARPRKNLTALQGSHTKEEMQNRLEHEERIRGNNDNLTPPDFIKEDLVALKKFNQLVEELRVADILSNVDMDLLAVYCDCWSKYVEATKMLSAQNLVELQESKNGFSKDQNPYIKVQNTYSDKLVKLSALFGLSPACRSKIAHLKPSDKHKKIDPLTELIMELR